MSIKAMVTVWENSKQKGNGLLLMLAVADFMNDFGEAWPSIDTLAKKTRCDRSTVIEMTKRCKADGELEVAEGGGRSSSNHYRLGRHYGSGWSEIPTATSTGKGRNQTVGIRPLEGGTVICERCGFLVERAALRMRCEGAHFVRMGEKKVGVSA